MNSLKHRIAEASGLPKDVLLGQPILTVLGYTEKLFAAPDILSPLFIHTFIDTRLM